MTGLLTALLRIIFSINSVILLIGRQIAWVALGLMVFVILLQVVARYIFNNALPWPDEAARFLMLWMTGLVAPSAYRWGGFVAIDMVPEALPKRVASLIYLILFVLSAITLIVAITFGWNHTMGFGGNFNSSSLRIPLDLFGGESIKVKLRYMYGSLLLGVFLLLMVNAELILRTLIGLIKPDADLPKDSHMMMAGAD
ncbi:MAG: TRAP transporter small permease subunit [Pseudomonadota bacterium]